MFHAGAAAAAVLSTRHHCDLLNLVLQRDAGSKRAGQAGPEGPRRDSGEFICSFTANSAPLRLLVTRRFCRPFIFYIFFTFKAKELQTLHNLRKLFVQDLATRVKKVRTTTKSTV